MERIRGLDAIRAVCALWVVMGHFGGPPLTAGIDDHAFAGRLVGGIINNFWNGPAAVIVFFVISGFCIHYPFSRPLRIPSLTGYAVRRYLRIGIPLVAAMALAPLLSVKLTLFHDSILWSLAAELVYYSLYPALLKVRRSGLRWEWMIAVGFALALALAATKPTAGNYPSFGVGLNWLLGLPCWLLGCLLAEQITRGKLPQLGGIWGWRLVVFGASVALSIARFHSPLTYPWTLNFFAILVAFWIAQEIFHYKVREPSPWLSWVGGWSYSIYLIHILAASIFAGIALPNFGYFLNWVNLMAFVLAASYLFYLAIELPGHRLARTLGRRLTRKIADTTVARPALADAAELPV